jgi:hypothetical protein
MTTYKTFYGEAEIDVDLDEWDDKELLEELKYRGYDIADYKDIKYNHTVILDDIFALYKEWLDDQGDRDNRFEKAMRKFFEKHLDKVSA